MLLDDVAQTSDAVAGVPGRLAKTRGLAECLRRAAPGEVPIVVAYLSGELRQRRTGLGYASLRDMPAPAAAPSLNVGEVDAEFAEIAAASGPGSTTARRARLRALLAGATTAEQRLLLRWAQVWRGKTREEYVRQTLFLEQHAPPQYRAHGPLVNIDAFYEAFNVQPGDKLYLDPKNRVRIW